MQAKISFNYLKKYSIIFSSIIFVSFGVYVLFITLSTYLQYFNKSVSEIISTIADDEFYVLKVAENFVNYNRITFDNSAVTTGFHPLYFLFLSMGYFFFKPDPKLFIEISILIKTMFYILSSFLLFFLIRKISHNKLVSFTIGILITLVFLAHPYFLFLIFSGLEQLISIFFFLCFLLTYIKFFKSQNSIQPTAIMFCGIFLGLTYLSRTDNIILLPIVCILIISAKINNLIKGLKYVGIFCFSFLITIIPWYIFIYLYTGTLTQGSGKIKMFLNNVDNLSFFQKVLRSFEFVKKFWLPFLNKELSFLYTIFWVLLLIVGMYFLLMNIPFSSLKLSLRNRILNKLDKRFYILLNLHIGAICLFYIFFISLTYGYIFYSAREWYYGISILAILIMFVIIINIIFLSAENKYFINFSIILIVFVSYFMFQSILKSQELDLGQSPHQKEMLVASEWMKTNLPPNAVVGSWNAGIFGYFSNRQVINLDGLINNDILPHLKKRTLYRYIEKRKINYIVDYSVMIYWQEKYLGKHISEIPLVQDTVFVGSWFLSDLSVWRITN